MGLQSNDKCWHCNKEKGFYFHMIWKCLMLQSFWKKVIINLSNIIREKIPFDPKLCILNYMDNMSWPPFKKKTVSIGLMSAKRVIVINWKITINIYEKV